MLYDSKRLLVNEVPTPVLQENEVLVKIKATAICGTDVSIYKGDIIPKLYPVIQGHESAGIIAELGTSVTGLAKGNPVIINPAYFCAECFYCQRELYNLCSSGGLLGRDCDGTFAEYAAVPAQGIIKLPENISFEDASTLQALATALRGWDRIDGVRPVGPEDTVAVIGLGAPGLLFTRLAVLAGAQVFSCGRTQYKLDIAQNYGGIPVNPNESDLKTLILDATEGRGADIVIESAGNAHTFGQALDVARPGASVLAFGIHRVIYDAYDFYFKELTVLGTRAMNNAGYHRAVALYNEGALDLSPMITHRFTLDELQDNFEKLDKEPGTHLRMVCQIT